MRATDRWAEFMRERTRRPQLPLEVESHLHEAVAWLHRAQDASTDRGVAHSFFIGKGWARSYPEATGYIIPTLLNWGETKRDSDAKRRALAMADWLLTVQTEKGAVPNLIGLPTVFDTGQVIFGWLSAYRATGKDTYLDAAKRAGDWLLAALDGDGVWRNPSDSGGPGRCYNARVAWALLELSRVSGDERYAAPMPRFLEWTLEQEQEEGWFDRNCMTDDSAPLLHTIAYTAQGQLESGLLLGSLELIAAAARTAHALVVHAGPDGWMPGRFARGWRPAANWACLTGMAQMSLVWQRLQGLEDVVGEEDVGLRFLSAANRVNAFLMRTQDCASRNGGLRGGIRGSYPVSGDYARWRVLNWATKFFVDALMEEVPGASVPYRY
jgi:squalene-hopene cyclase-like protein